MSAGDQPSQEPGADFPPASTNQSPGPTPPQAYTAPTPAGLASCDDCSDGSSERSGIFSYCPLLPAQDELPAVALRADLQLHIRNGEFVSFPRLPIHPLHQKSNIKKRNGGGGPFPGKPHPHCSGPDRALREVRVDLGTCALCWAAGVRQAASPLVGWGVSPGGTGAQITRSAWPAMITLSLPHSSPFQKIKGKNKHINWPIVWNHFQFRLFRY